MGDGEESMRVEDGNCVRLVVSIFLMQREFFELVIFICKNVCSVRVMCVVHHVRRESWN